MSLWQFSQIPCIEESAFNKVLERFYDFGIAGLVRENIQNSLDGKLPGETKPVCVTINTGSIAKENIPGLSEIKERIMALQGRNTYTRETIDHMRNKMNDESIHYISFEDENTKGLRGAKNGQSTSPEDTWSIYAYNKGVHTEEADETVEKSRGGSHGIGKIASNAASELYMMYFANCDAEGNQHLGGTVQLIEHQYKDNYYRSTGYFTDIKALSDGSTRFYPFENTFNPVFKKNTRGLKIIIPFLREQFNNEREIIRSVCDSFFMAILQKKLEVVVNGKSINYKTIGKYIKDENYYVQDIEKITEDFTPLYFETYSKQEPIPVVIEDVKEKYHFNLYFNYDPAISKGRVAIIRTIGMKIEDKKVKGNVNKPFNAVLVPDSITEDAFLKSLENESHTELAFEHIKDQKLQRNAKRFINNISKMMVKIIEDAIKKSNPTDGVMNTGDILYIVENQFKQELAKTTSTVHLNQGENEQTVVKINTEIPKKDRKSPEEKNLPKREQKPPRTMKEIKNKNGEENEEQEEGVGERSLFRVYPEIVDRIIIGNKEILRFDFRGSEEGKKAKNCHLSITVINGMGEECPKEFNMLNNYESIIDKATGAALKMEEYRIRNIKINKGIAQIECKLKSNFNKALKFVYYVEV